MDIGKKTYSLPCVRIVQFFEKDVITDSVNGVGYFNKDWVTNNNEQGT